MTDPLLRILSNRPEIVADRDLQEVVAVAGDRLFAKVPVAEAIDIDHADVAKAADRGFLLASNFDFLVARDNRPIFVVEIDGKRHSSDSKTIERDRKKDAACEAAGLPILRIASDLALRRVGKQSILKYVADSYYLFEAFHEAQKEGPIPWDEPFDRSSITRWDSGGTPIRTPDDASIGYLERMNEQGKLPAWVPNSIVVSVPESRNVRCVNFLAVALDRFIFADVQVRDFRFVGISPSDVAESISLLELAEQVKRWLSGEAVAINRRRLGRTFDELQVACDAGLFLSTRSSSYNSDIAGGLPEFRMRFGRRN